MRIIGLDIGKERIGIAISDELKTYAYNLKTIKSDKNTIEQLREIIQEFGVSELVVGLPKTLKGELGTMAQYVQKFGQSLEKQLKIKVKFWDERFTTKEAYNVLCETGIRGKKRKNKIDMLSAAIMLQSYLDRYYKK